MDLAGRMKAQRSSALAAAMLSAALLLGLALGEGGIPSPARHARRVQMLGPVPPEATVAFSLVLRNREGALRRFLDDLNDPGSPRYRHYLTAAQFGARFGPSRARLAGLRRLLAVRGVPVVRSYPQRTALELRASAATVERLMGVRLVRFVDGTGARWRAPIGTPRLPRRMRPAVEAVSGLDTRPVYRPADVPRRGLAPPDLARAYDIEPLHRAGFNGEGQTVAVLSFSTSDDRDVALFDSVTHITGPPVKRVLVRGGGAIDDGTIEVNLDIDTVRAVAPKAQIIDYEAPASGEIGELVDRMVADRRAKIASLSWGNCDFPTLFRPGGRERTTRALQSAVSQGITIFEASGDHGAYECQSKWPNTAFPSVDYPSASPLVVSVGGTLLSVRENGDYLVEHGWEDVLAGYGGGGGRSPIEARPSWQAGPGVLNAYSNGRRQIPDVAGPADPYSGVVVASKGKITRGNGTSQAAPFWAGSMALIRQFAGALGYVNPLLYRIALTNPAAFHDVTSGGNRLFRAGPGWDYATGLGSPDVTRLARAVRDSVRRR